MPNMPRSGTMRLWLKLTIIFLVGVALVDCDCPVGWVLSESESPKSQKCFKFYGNQKMVFDAAETFCESNGGYLARDTDKETHSTLSRYIYQAGKTGGKPSSFWIGLADTNKDGPWKWVGRGPFLGTFNGWRDNTSPYNSKNDRNCVYISTRDSTGTWIPTRSCDAIKAFVCQVDYDSTKVTKKPIAKIHCPSGWNAYNAGKLCLYLSHEIKSYSESSAYCNQQGGALVKIADASMNGYIESLWTERKENFYIGLDDIKQEGTFIWNFDNTEASFTNWDLNEPNNFGDEDCTFILYRIFKWNDGHCRDQHRFICQRPPLSGPTQKTITTATIPTANVNCDAGWEEDKSSIYCYQIKRDRKTWLDARNYCQGQEGILATIPSLETQAYLTGRLQSYDDNFLWIGANDRSSEGGWRWAERAPFAFFNWDTDQPDRSNDQDCVGMVPKTGRWNDLICTNKYGFICQKQGKRTVPTIPPVTSPARIPTGQKWGCPPGWSGFRNSCYQYFISKIDGITWFQAKTYCRAGHQADLVSISDYLENYFVSSRIPRTYPFDIWIGLNDNRNENTFVWSDNSQVTYTRWGRNQPDGRGEHDCVVLRAKTGYWDDTHCTDELRKLFVCEKSKAILSKTSTALTDGCPQYYYGLYDKCYGFNDRPRTFDSAEHFCKLQKGHLAVIDSNYVQAFLTPYMNIKAGDEYWIGLSLRAVTNYTYKWTDGSDVHFTNWNRHTTGNENNTCIAMQVKRPSGLWVNKDCPATKLGCVCQVPRKGDYTAPTTITTVKTLVPCPSGWLQYKEMCYKPFAPEQAADKLTWRESRAQCESFAQGGTLVTISDSSIYYWLLRQIKTQLKLDTKTGYWIGLNDLDQESGYKWTDGSGMTWTQWENGQPDNQKSQDCVQWDMRVLTYGSWKDDHCSLAKNFICQFPRGALFYTPRPTISLGPTGGVKCGDPDWTYYSVTGMCYYISPSSGENATASWFQAERLCNSMGAHLTSVTNEDEDNMLITLTSKHYTGYGYIFRDFWIGLNSLDDGIRRWVDREQIKYLAYGKWGQKNNDVQRCVKRISGGTWTDERCNKKMGYICKRHTGDFNPVIPPRTIPQGNCPEGYFTNDLVSHCYKAFVAEKDRVLFSKARDMCKQRSRGGDLASVHNAFENDFIFTLLRGTSSPVWIGMRSEYYQIRTWFHWTDGSEIDYENMGPPSKRTTYSTSKCVAINNEDYYNGKWNYHPCYSFHGHVCQRPKSTTLPKKVPDNKDCPTDYQWYGNSCYRLTIASYTWKKAEQVCNGEKGHLMSITDGFESAFFNILTAKIRSKVWIGLKYDIANELYRWSDGWHVTYDRFSGDERRPLVDGECVSSNMSRHWEDTPCLKTLPFVCEINLGTPPPLPTGFVLGLCEDGWTRYKDFCYLIKNDLAVRTTRPSAKYDCHAEGGQLASLLTKEENDFVWGLVPSGYNSYWFGLRKGVTTGYQWDDKSAVDYTHFSLSNEKDDKNELKQGFCYAIEASAHWVKLDCFEHLGYICKKPRKRYFTDTPTMSTNALTTSTSKTKPTIKSTTPLISKPTPSTTKPTTTTPLTPTTAKKTSPKIQPKVTQETQLGPQIHNTAAYSGGSPSDNGLSGGTVAGIIIGVLVVVVITFLVVFFVRRGSADSMLMRVKTSKFFPASKQPKEDPAGFENMMYNTTSGTLSGAFSSDA